MFCIRIANLTEEELIRLATEQLRNKSSEWEQNIWKFIQMWFDPDVSSVPVNTSGSTGIPKEIKHSKQAMLHSAKLTSSALQLKEGNKALLCLPTNKISGMMMLVRAIHQKMDLYCIRPSANPLSELCAEDTFDFAAFTPMQLFEITESKEKFKLAEGIRKIILGGEKVNHQLLESIKQMKNDTYATFGMTETISHIALRKLNGKKAKDSFTTFDAIRISTDERSCLVIEAPELEVEHLVTNDVVNLISANEFEWLGRADNIINSGGVKIFPEKVEEQLSSFLTFPFFIGAVEDERLGQKLVLVTESKSVEAKDEAAIIKEVLAQLSPHQRPKEILVCSAFSRTENGKVKRRESLENTVRTIVI